MPSQIEFLLFFFLLAYVSVSVWIHPFIFPRLELACKPSVSTLDASFRNEHGKIPSICHFWHISWENGKKTPFLQTIKQCHIPCSLWRRVAITSPCAERHQHQWKKNWGQNRKPSNLDNVDACLVGFLGQVDFDLCTCSIPCLSLLTKRL